MPPERIPAIVATHAARWPAAPAILTGTECWTYAQLQARAQQLAHYLRTRGIGQGTVVGVALDRAKPRLVQAVLALWKIGAIYLPLDPGAPPARVAFVLEDAGATWILTEARPPGPLPPTAAQILTLEDLGPELPPGPGVPLPEEGTGADPAYIIYTSGSTGTPKGVLLYHQGLRNVQLAQQHTFGLGPGDRVLQFSHGTYDASIFEIVLALSAGAALVLLPARARQPGPDLVQTCQEQNVTVVVLTPSVLASLPPTDVPTLHTIIAAGEACPAELVRHWATEGRRFFNAYGPTESTIWATVARCQPDGREPAIGRPIANTELYVLDPTDATRQAARGAVGELAISGAGLGRYQDPTLQATRFVPHPTIAGALIYRTGDLVQWRADDQLYFCGRVDDQVKIRGRRIEPGEVAAGLARHPAIRESFVRAWAPASGPAGLPEEAQLVAYVIPAATERTSAVAPPVPDAELRAFLAQHLPAYLIPAAFCWLPAFPLTPSGKVDRAALPPPSLAGMGAGEGDLLTQVLEVIARVLQVAPNTVAPDVDFFELGGHSLLVPALILGLQRQCGVVLESRDVFQARTAARLAAQVAARRVAPPTPAHPAA